MEENLFELMAASLQKQEIEKVVDCNQKTEAFGLRLTEEDAQMLMACRKENLKEQQRVEFGEGVLPQIIYAFCDSQYISQDNYVETMSALQEIFYLFKNESIDEVPDSELIQFMREEFENVCFGSLEYLEETCLERFSRAVRSGYRGFLKSGGDREYGELDEETRWDNEVYIQKLSELSD